MSSTLFGLCRISRYVTGTPSYSIETHTWPAKPSEKQIHRRRAAARWLVRLEVQAPKRDADLIRALAETLRDESVKAKVLRSTLVKALVHLEIRTAFDVFGSDLPNEVFAGVFEQPRQWQWREINL
jgi:hypothetical protein